MLNKLIASISDVLTDHTAALEDYYGGTAALVLAPGDKLYIGSKLPFTRKFCKVSSPNAQPAEATVQYWAGSWQNAVNVTDETGALSRSGYLSWETDKRYGWVVADTDAVTGLTSKTLYDYYWVAVSFDDTVTATLAWVGDVFCTDSDLAAQHPDLVRANVIASWKAGKTDWEEQRIAASKLMAQDLKQFWVAQDASQVLVRDQLVGPAVAKTAEIIAGGFGKSEDEARHAARYKSQLDPKAFTVDTSKAGRVTVVETVKSTRLTR